MPTPRACQVVVTAVRAVHEGDPLARTIRQAQARDLGAKVHHAADVGREKQHMRQAPGAHRCRAAARWRRTLSQRHHRCRTGPGFLARRDLGRDHQLQGCADWVVQPQARSIGLGVRRTCQAQSGDSFGHGGLVSRIDRKTHVCQPLRTRTDKDRGPNMAAALGAQIQTVALTADRQTEMPVKMLGLGQIRHRQHKTVDRVDGMHAGAAQQFGSVHVGLRSTPSMGKPGSCATPAAANTVADQSMVRLGVSCTIPAPMRRGQRTSKGTRKPDCCPPPPTAPIRCSFWWPPRATKCPPACPPKPG